MTGENRFKVIKDLVEKRDKYLAEYPELQPLQDEINEVLLNAGSDFHERNRALQELMLNTWCRVIGVWEGKE